jgi:hypothetical protein
LVNGFFYEIFCRFRLTDACWFALADHAVIQPQDIPRDTRKLLAGAKSK